MSRCPNASNPVLEEARRYRLLGLSVLPIGKEKRPALKSWKQFQEVAPDATTIESWFGVPGKGLGIILGPVSGDLVVRDFDDNEAFVAWRKEYPELAATLPKVRTKRGVHLYVRIRDWKTQNYGDGELRGAGSYVVAPPSEHPAGGSYRWLKPLVSLEDVPLLEADETGFNRDWGKTDRGSLASLGSLCTPAPLCSPLSSQPLLRRNFETIPESVLEAIQSTLPRTGFKRHKAIFELTRWFRGSPEFRDVDPRDLKLFVREWHRRALNEIGTKAFEETWIDFLSGWTKVRSPIGSGSDSIHAAMRRADELPPPEAANQFDGAEIRRLVALCRELQKSAGDAPFFLACRVPEEWLKAPHTKVNRWLNHFVREGILSIVTPGTKAEATRYRYHGD